MKPLTDMTQEQFDKAVKLHHRLENLLEAREEISGTTGHRLMYGRMVVPQGSGVSAAETADPRVMLHIAGILKRHDAMIRREIDLEIAHIHRQIKQL